jgi:hypothetical protein
MLIIPLNAQPNQRLTVRLEGQLYEITVKAAAGCLVCSISRNGLELVANTRCLPWKALIPYQYLEDGGNFCFVNEDKAYPAYARLGVQDQLVYVTAEELKELRHA